MPYLALPRHGRGSVCLPAASKANPRGGFVFAFRPAENRRTPARPTKANICTPIFASKDAEALSRYDLLFNRNVRVWLGKTDVNQDIAKTFKNAPKEFAYSNNGVTILCEKHTPDPASQELEIVNPRVVNGSQTLHSVADIASLGADSQAARVMLRIIQIPKLEPAHLPEEARRRKQIIRKIALRNNSQNVIKKWDLVSNDDFQLELARYFRTKGLFYERRRGEWSNRRTDLKSVGVERGPEIKRLVQLIASYYWDKDQLGPVAAKNPAKLFEDKEYEKITETHAEVAYQLFLLENIMEAHVRELSQSRLYVKNAARQVKYALFALLVRALQSIDVNWGSEEFTTVLETELSDQTPRWRKFVLSAFDYIRAAFRAEDKRYRQREKQPLTIANFAKSKTYINKLFPPAVARNLRTAGRAVL